MRRRPVVADAGVDDQRDRELGGIFHHGASHVLGLVEFPLGHLEQQFVVHLEQHPCREFRPGQRRRHANHRLLDDVGGAALQRGVDGGAFGEGAHALALVVDEAQVDLAAERRQHIAVLAREVLGPLHVVADAGVTLEIFGDVFLGLLLADAELVGEAEGRDAVDDAEVDRLGAPPHQRVHALHRHAEHVGGGDGVDVVAAREGLLQGRNVGDMRQQAQLDLRIVGAEQLVAGLGDEGLADLAALLAAHRNVLQVGIGRGETARGGAGHVIRGVDAAGLGIDLAHQRVGVGAFQLGELAVLEDLHRQRMALRREVFQHRGVGRPGAVLVALAAGQLLFVEQDFAQLLGRADVELAAGDLVDLALEFGQPLLEVGTEPLELQRIDLDAGGFHRQQHRDQRPLDGLVH